MFSWISVLFDRFGTMGRGRIVEKRLLCTSRLSLLAIISLIACVAVVNGYQENLTGKIDVDTSHVASGSQFCGAGDKSCSSEGKASSTGGKAAILIAMFETFKSHPLGYIAFVLMLTG